MHIDRATFAEAEARRVAGTGQDKFTAVHKVNVMRVSDGLFLECVRLVAKDYPQIAYGERLVDAMCAHLVRNLAEFDVICTTNMFGDILSDLASEIADSLGVGRLSECRSRLRYGTGAA